MTESVGPEVAKASLTDLLVVLVTYKQSPRASTTLQSLEPQVRAIGSTVSLLIYDNSPAAALEEDLPDARVWSITYRHDPSNAGVSAGYRAGAKLAASLGKRWLLLLDQDTRFASDALGAYFEAMHANSEVAIFSPRLRAGTVLVSPCMYRYKRGTSLRTIASGWWPFHRMSVLNSGMYITLDAYTRCGGHDPALPLDFSDHEFVERLAKVTPGFVVVDTTAEHGFSGMEAESADSAAVRFRAYVRGALRSSKTTRDIVASCVLVLERAAFLSWRHRTTAFLRIATGVLFGAG